MKLTIVNRWNGSVILEGDFDSIKELISAFPDANLSGANLSGANLSGANLDYSTWPLRCSSTKAIVDDRLKAQLMYHALCLVGNSVTIPQEMKDFVNNNFHRIGELPKL